MTEANLSGQEVFDRLLGEIEREELQSGARMRESSIAAKYGVSRTPVREALKRMEAIGLLTHAPHRGMIVLEQNAARKRNLFSMRRALVCAAAREAADSDPDADLDVLRDTVDEIRACPPERRRKSFALAKVERALCELAGNQPLEEMIRQVGLKHQISGKPCDIEGDLWPSLTSLLDELVAGVAMKRPDAAEQAISRLFDFPRP